MMSSQSLYNGTEALINGNLADEIDEFLYCRCDVDLKESCVCREYEASFCNTAISGYFIHCPVYLLFLAANFPPLLHTTISSLSVISYQFNPLDFNPSNSSLAAGGDDITETLTAKAYRRRDLLSYVAIVSGRLKRSLPAEKTAGQSPRMSVDYNRLRKYSNIRLSPDLNQKFVPMVSVSDN